MEKSLVNHIKELKRYEINSDAVSLLNLIEHCGRKPPVSINELLSGVCSGERPNGTGGGVSNTPNDDYFGFPPEPRYIKFNNSQDQFTIYFNDFIDDYPTIELPYYMEYQLPCYPNNGNPIFPNNCCGLRFLLPTRFHWTDSAGNLIGLLPHDYHDVYVSTPEDKGIYYEDVGLGSLFNSVELSGPIGKCINGKDWYLQNPLTKNGRLDINNRDVVLTITFDGEIEFLSSQHDDSALFEELKYIEEKIKYYDKKMFKAFENALKFAKETKKEFMVEKTIDYIKSIPKKDLKRDFPGLYILIWG
jgi:hypothetical protein